MFKVDLIPLLRYAKVEIDVLDCTKATIKNNRSKPITLVRKKTNFGGEDETLEKPEKVIQPGDVYTTDSFTSGLYYFTIKCEGLSDSTSCFAYSGA